MHSVASDTMDQQRLILKAGVTLCLLILTVHSESRQEFEYKLPLPAARSVRSQGDNRDSVNPEYKFRYFVRNEDTGDFKSQEESRDGKSVVGRYTVAEPTGHVREVKYTADEKHGFRADVKIHSPGTFETKVAEKRSAEDEQENDSKDKNEEVQSDKTFEEAKEEEQLADETKSQEELLVNDKPQQPEEMTDEEVEKTLEKQEHILNPQEHEHSHTDEEKSADAGANNEQTDNLIITVNAEKKPPVADNKAEAAKTPVHITHAVKDPISQPAYPFITPHFYSPSPYPYSNRIPHPAVADSPHPIPHPAVVDNHHSHIPHPAVVDFHLKTPAPLPAPAPLLPPAHPAAPIPALLPSFIYQDHPIAPVSPLFIQQPSHQAHHFLPGNVQDILAAKQASIQDVENMVRHATADESRHNEKQSSYGFQIVPKPMMFQLSDPPVHLLVPSNQFEQSYKTLSYLAPHYPYNVPYYYQPTQDGLGRAGIPQYFIDNGTPEDAQKSILSNFDFMKPLAPFVNNIPPQYLPQKLRPISSTAAPAPVNADQVSSTPKLEVPQQTPAPPVQIQVNKVPTPAPPTASSPSHYFNFPFLYPLTTFLQRPFLQHNAPQTAPQPLQTSQAQKDQVQAQQEDPQKIQKPVAQQPMPAATTTQNDQQRYYVIQPSFPPNGQYRYNPSYPYNAPVPTPPPQQKSAVPMKPAPVRSQPVPTQAHVPVQSQPQVDRSSNLYSFPYNSPVALLVLPMTSDQQPQHTKINEHKGVTHTMDSYYKK